MHSKFGEKFKTLDLNIVLISEAKINELDVTV